MRSHAQTHLNAQTHARALMQSSPCPLKSRDSFLVPRDSIAAAREMFTAINPLLIRHSPAWDAHNSSRQSVTEPWAPLPPPPVPLSLPSPFLFPSLFPFSLCFSLLCLPCASYPLLHLTLCSIMIPFSQCSTRYSFLLLLLSLSLFYFHPLSPSPILSPILFHPVPSSLHIV